MTFRGLILIAAAASAALLAGAHVFEALGYAPCKLCLWQRGPHWAALGIGIAAYALQWRFLAWLGSLAAATTGAPGLRSHGPEPARISALYTDDTGAAILQFMSASEHGLVDLAVDPPRVVRFRLLAEPTIGVLRQRGDFVAVLRSGAFVRVPPAGACERMPVSITNRSR